MTKIGLLLAFLVSSHALLMADHGRPQAGARPSAEGQLWTSEAINQACSAVYPAGPMNELGAPVRQLEPNRVYRKYDSSANRDLVPGNLVYVLTDANGNLDERPLAEGSVIPCSYLPKDAYVKDGDPARWGDPSKDFSDQCLLSDKENEAFVQLRLDKDGKKRNTQIARLTLMVRDQSQTEPIWEIVSEREIPEGKRPAEAAAQTKEGPLPDGSKVAKFNGADYTIAAGHHLERLNSSGTVYAVPDGHHLEGWPSMRGEAWVVPDGQELIRARSLNAKTGRWEAWRFGTQPEQSGYAGYHYADETGGNTATSPSALKR